MDVSFYFEHLNEADVSLIISTAAETDRPDVARSRLRADSAYLEALLRHPAVFDRLFGGGPVDGLMQASPFLVFAVLVARTSADLTRARFVNEWIGAGRRVPMFDVSGVRTFAQDPTNRFFLAELLTSYTHVASGSVWIRTARGPRRRKYSDLDPFRLLELARMVPDSDRPYVHRRLGDLMLFLTGVFPDCTASAFVSPIQRQRLLRLLRAMEGGQGEEGPGAPEVELLTRLGEASYTRAAAPKGLGGGGSSRLLDMANHFGDARRFLNVMTDRYLYPLRDQWFHPPV